jgi:hypothetical protein
MWEGTSKGEKGRCLFRRAAPEFSGDTEAIPLYAMEALGGERRCSSYSFSTSALDGGDWSASRPGRVLPPGKAFPVPIGQEAGWASEPVWTLRLEEKCIALPGIELRSPGRPVRSQTLYWLSYPDSLFISVERKMFTMIVGTPLNYILQTYLFPRDTVAAFLLDLHKKFWLWDLK